MNGAENTKLQFQVLRRQFLFRIADLEGLSAYALGDANKLLGQFAALLILVSVIISFGAFGTADANLPPAERLAMTVSIQYFLVSTTMLAVGVFAVLSWDSTFPDRRDVLVLSPLPVRAWTIFRAKVAATGTALGLVVVLFHCAAGLTWPFAFAVKGAGFLGFVRSFAAYWFTMLAAGAFIYCAVLAIQGFAAQILPRRLFLRVSGLLQTAAFGLFVCTYFLEPPVGSVDVLTASKNVHLPLWIPTYWFLGLLNQLNGSPHPALASRAWEGLAVAALSAAVAYALSYVRTMRRILEEPDITSGPRGFSWLPRFGSSEQTAIGQFCVRSLARSRQHRLILTFYWGIGLAFTLVLLPLLDMAPRGPGGPAMYIWHQPSTPVLTASIMMMALAVLGARVVFALPLELRANWIFRVVGTHDVREILVSSGRALLLLSVVPVWLLSTAVCLPLWPWRQAAAHLLVLGLLGSIFADVALYGFRKIPFACSHLPGKSQVHMMVVAAVVVMSFVAQGVILEREMLHRRGIAALALALLGFVAIGIHWRVKALAKSDQEGLQFEEESPAILELRL